MDKKQPQFTKAVLDSLPIALVLEWRAKSAPPKPLVHVRTTSTLGDAVAKLKASNVLSLPVWNDDEGAFVEFVTCLDVLQYCTACKDAPMNTTVAAVLEGVGKEVKTQMEIMPHDGCVGELMEWFSLSMHRVIVNDPDGPVSGPSGFLLSQSDVVRFLQAHPDSIRPITGATLQECGLADKRRASTGPIAISSVGPNTNLIEAFAKLSDHSTSAVAVVDDGGTLVENLSASDLRGLSEKDLDHYAALSVMDFLRMRHGDQCPPLTCKRSSTLAEVIDILALKHVHRLWVVDEDGGLEGVVSLTDILTKFAPFDYKKLDPRKV